MKKVLFSKTSDLFSTSQLELGAIPILRQHIFGRFGPHPPYQHKYSTKRQQKGPFSRPTHPPYQPKYSTEHQPKGPFSRPTHPPFADVI